MASVMQVREHSGLCDRTKGLKTLKDAGQNIYF